MFGGFQSDAFQTNYQQVGGAIVSDVRGGFPDHAMQRAFAARRLRLERDDREILEIIQIFMIHDRLP